MRYAHQNVCKVLRFVLGQVNREIMHDDLLNRRVDVNVQSCFVTGFHGNGAPFDGGVGAKCVSRNRRA